MSTQPFVHQHRVVYADCTVGDHVYYARYLDILEAARGELLRAVGLPLKAALDQGFIFPVIEVGLQYKSLARYDDLLTIHVWLSEIGRLRLVFQYRILNPDGKLILEGHTQHISAGPDERPKRLPAERVQLFEPFLIPNTPTSKP